jgi:hypothetical protein
MFENIIQATSADFLSLGCVRAEKKGYDIFMAVHDQVLGLHKEGQTTEGLAGVMCVKPAWAEDFPLAGECDITPYYLK